MHERDGDKAPHGPGPETSGGGNEAKIEPCEIKARLHHRMRQRKDNARPKDAQRAVKIEADHKAVAARQINKADGGHDRRRKKRRHEKDLEGPAADRARERDGIGNDKPEDRRRCGYGRPHPERVGDRAQVVGRQVRGRFARLAHDNKGEFGKRHQNARRQKSGRKRQQPNRGARQKARRTRHCGPQERQRLRGSSTAMSAFSAKTAASVAARSASAVTTV